MRMVSRLSALLLSLACVLAAQDTQSKSDPKKDPDQIGNRDVSKGVDFYSIQQELKMGKILAAEVRKHSRVITDPLIGEYINRVGQNLARNSDSKFPLNVEVIEGDDINAITVPGGYIFVETGLIRVAATEAELAGAMAHEVAHVAARHATRQATRDQIAGLSTIPLIFLGGWAGYGARQVSGVAVPLAGQGFSRDFEAEADMLGLQYLYKAGYDPVGMVDIFEKIEAHEPKKPGFFMRIASSHPPTGDRLVAVQKNIQEHLKSQPQYVVSTSEFARVKARLEALDEAHRQRKVDPEKPTLYRKLS